MKRLTFDGIDTKAILIAAWNEWSRDRGGALQVELANASGVQSSQLSRALSSSGWAPNLTTLATLLNAMGYRVKVTLEKI